MDVLVEDFAVGGFSKKPGFGQLQGFGSRTSLCLPFLGDSELSEAVALFRVSRVQGF